MGIVAERDHKMSEMLSMNTSSFNYTFTIFTPTYNRASTLHRVYESLVCQTFQDFEWLIVDDGSTDNTKEVVEEWQNSASFPIRYYWQNNQGKHIAFNFGVQEARGELFLTLDSDDACKPFALDRLKYHWDRIPICERDRFSAVTARKHPFPVVRGVKFIPEGIVWNAIAVNYRTRFINEKLRVYLSNEGSSSDQLTKNVDPSMHAIGHALWHRSILVHNLDWMPYSPREFVISATHYNRFSFHARIGTLKRFSGIHNFMARNLIALTYLLGLFLYWKDRLRIKKIRK